MGIASHIRLAAIAEDLIVFDVRADRYLALVGAIDIVPDATASTLFDPSLLHPGAAQALEKAGFLVEEDNGGAIHVPSARGALEARETAIGMRDVFRLLLALIRTGWRIYRGRHVASFSAVPLPPCSSGDLQRLDLAIAKLRRLRLYVPTPSRCLPAALTASFFVRQFGVDVDLVFGVRGHPFDAHCWIERGGIVLDDELDRIAAYTPIAVGALCR